MAFWVHPVYQFVESCLVQFYPEGLLVPQPFSLIERIPIAISLALSVQVVFVLFRSIGIPVQFFNAEESTGR